MININPWLAEQVKAYRALHSDEELRQEYAVCGPSADGVSICSWDVFLRTKALQEAMSMESFLQMPIAQMAFPQCIHRGLYMAGADCGADLLQLTKEELHAVAEIFDFEADTVEKYLARYGETLYSSRERTLKISGLGILQDERGDGCAGQIWTIPSPGARFEFRFDRPSLLPEWFEAFYRRNGHYDGEEKDNIIIASVQAPNLSEDNLPTDYYEFFHATKTVWDAYEACCHEQSIQPLIPRPTLPTADVLPVYRGGVKTVVDVLERTTLLAKQKKGEYLSSSDDQKLYIAETVADSNLKLLLISLVELKIDIEKHCHLSPGTRKGASQMRL